MMLWSRLRALFRRWRRPASWERALDDELRSYVEHEIDARLEAGMSPAEARRTALAEFGGVEQVKEHVRAGVTGSWVDTLYQDVCQASRALRHSRGYAVWVVASLAIGMAVMIAALAFLNTMLLRPFPAITEQERLVRISVSRGCGQPGCWNRMSSLEDYAVLRDGLAGLQGLAAYTLRDLAVGLSDTRSMRGALTSANYFDVIGVRPAIGRSFDETDRETRASVAVIAHSLWTGEFGADPSVIGQPVRIGDEYVQIIGVAPEFFVGIDLKPGGRGPDVWLPNWLADRVSPLKVAEQRRQEPENYFVGRLKEGVEAPQVRAAAQVLAVQLAQSRSQQTAEARADVQRVWRVRPENWHLGVGLVMPIPILVLAITCINAANLMLARGSQRQREMAIRIAIGAGRGRIIRQLLMESAILTLLAAAIAAPMAWWGLKAASSPLNAPITLDATVLALTLITAAGTAVAFGLAPAVRISAQQPAIALAPAGARSDAVPRQSRARRALVIAQIALSLGLLATAWQLIATVRSEGVSAGVPAERLLIARFDLQPLKLPPDQTESFYSKLVDGVSRLPDVEAAGVARHTSVWTFGRIAPTGTFVVWHPSDGPDDGRVTLGGYAGGELFEALGLRTLQGRSFTDAERQGRPLVAVVNDSFAQGMSGPTVGSFIRVAPRNQDFASSVEVRIVGVVEGTMAPRYAQDSPPAKVYLPSPIEPEPALALYVRTRTSATALASPVRETAHQISPRVAVLELGSLEDLNERTYGPWLWLARAAAFLGIVGLLLAMAGLYGVSSYVVAMRSREIAIRMAVGATPRDILAMVLVEFMRVALIGLVLGGCAAVVISLLIQSEYHGIQGIDGAAFGGASALFLFAMLLASAVPAVRASRLDPVENLKDG